jgi:hypothetical protein
LKFHLNLTEMMGTLMKTKLHFCSYLAQFFLNKKNKTHIPYSGTFFQNRPFMVYKIMQTNIVGPDRAQMTTWHMCTACWIPKATNTHSQYVVLLAFPWPQWLHECTSTLHYMYIVCLVFPLYKDYICNTKQFSASRKQNHTVNSIFIYRKDWTVNITQNTE